MDEVVLTPHVAKIAKKHYNNSITGINNEN